MSSLLNLSESFFEFIKAHQNDDVRELMLKYSSKIKEFPLDFAVTQIKCRKSTRKKLSDFLHNDRFLFPAELSGEQATDRLVAKYHARLIGRGKSVIDMTAGLGIDCMTAAAAGNTVTAIEIDRLKAECLSYNSKWLGIDNLSIINSDSIQYLESHPEAKADVLFIDPSRRDESNGRLYGLEDCSPDVVKHLGLLTSRADKIVIKASPMLDITQVLNRLPEVTEIHIVCRNGECKEMLIIADRNVEKSKSEAEITVADIDSDGNTSIRKFTAEELDSKRHKAEPQGFICNVDDIVSGKYLYDPNAGIHKLNASAVLCRQYEGLQKLSPNTELYISEKEYDNFPGRKFLITDIPDRKTLRRLKGLKYDVLTRNYTMSSEALRKKLNLKAGDDGKYIVGVKAGAKQMPIIIECRKMPK